MSALPFSDVVDGLRGPALDGPIPIARLIGKLVTVKPGDRARASLILASIAGGPAETAREVDLSLATMTPNACGLTLHFAATLQTTPVDGNTIARALQKMATLLTEGLGAPIPASTLLDATVLEALRTCGASWGPDALLAGNRTCAEEMCRHVLAATRISIETQEGLETIDASRARLLAMDARRQSERARRDRIEKAVRASLPEP